MKFSTGFFLIGNSYLAYMHEMIDKLASAIFKKNNIDECSVEELNDLVSRYPFFSSAHVLLSAKLAQTDSSKSAIQIKTTSLYVNNPLWLNHLLCSEQKIHEAVPLQKVIAEVEVVQEPNNDELVVENPRPEIPHKQETGSNEISVAKMASDLKIEKALPNNESLVFEPYHTVDYFASQGIKNIIEERPKDKLGQQLKSFTEWLKTIRQLPPQEVAALTSDSGSEEKVIQLATNSLEDGNIETESMAEVWIKQGKPEKAIDIYNKLSLIYPSKSSYFAGLIEKLKNN